MAASDWRQLGISNIAKLMISMHHVNSFLYDALWPVLLILNCWPYGLKSLIKFGQVQSDLIATLLNCSKAVTHDISSHIDLYVEK